MKRFGCGLLKRFLILWFPLFMIVPAFGQESQSVENELVPSSEEPVQSPQPPSGTVTQQSVSVNAAQNAVLEGVQLSSEPSREPHETVVTCYFIFKDKPSSYFYEVKKKTNKLVFEFNDTQKGNAPVASQKLAPILGLEVEQGKVDVNKEVKGLNPEWHDMVTVAFNLSAIPKINVTDEYNVISFSFKWSSDPARARSLSVHETKLNAGAVAGISGGILVAGGVAGYFIWNAFKGRGPAAAGDVDTSDIPVHVGKMW
jgi:hypothetical protein